MIYPDVKDTWAALYRVWGEDDFVEMTDSGLVGPSAEIQRKSVAEDLG